MHGIFDLPSRVFDCQICTLGNVESLWAFCAHKRSNYHGRVVGTRSRLRMITSDGTRYPVQAYIHGRSISDRSDISAGLAITHVDLWSSHVSKTLISRRDFSGVIRCQRGPLRADNWLALCSHLSKQCEEGWSYYYTRVSWMLGSDHLMYSTVGE
jgi:hypothetical protein